VRGTGDGLEQVHVAFVGREDVERDGSEQRIARLLEGNGASDVRKRHSTVLARDMRRQEPCGASARDQLAAQLLGGAVPGAARIALQRHDLVGDKGADALLQVAQLRCDVEIQSVSDARLQMSKKTVSSGPWRWMSNR